jgi:hypothetical protein
MSFADICAAYIAERRAAGCRMDKEERALARLAALHAGMGCPGDALPRALVEAWCAGRPGEAEPCQYNGQWDPRFYAASIVSGSYARALSKRSKNSSIAFAGTRSPMDSCGR